jgi:hypothetical protein
MQNDPLATPPPPPVERLNRAVLLVAALIVMVTLLVVAFLVAPRTAPRGPVPAAPALAAGTPGFLNRPPGTLPPAPAAPPSEQDYLRSLLERALPGGGEGGYLAGGAGAAAGAQAVPMGMAGPAGMAGTAGMAGMAGMAGTAAQVPGMGQAPPMPPGLGAGSGQAAELPGGLAAGSSTGPGAPPAAARDPRREEFLRALRAPLAAPVPPSLPPGLGVPPPPGLAGQGGQVSLGLGRTGAQAWPGLTVPGASGPLEAAATAATATTMAAAATGTTAAAATGATAATTDEAGSAGGSAAAGISGGGAVYGSSNGGAASGSSGGSAAVGPAGTPAAGLSGAAPAPARVPGAGAAAGSPGGWATGGRGGSATGVTGASATGVTGASALGVSGASASGFPGGWAAGLSGSAAAGLPGGAAPGASGLVTRQVAGTAAAQALNVDAGAGTAESGSVDGRVLGAAAFGSSPAPTVGHGADAGMDAAGGRAAGAGRGGGPGAGLLEVAYHPPAAVTTLAAGTLIPALLETEVNSDLPGPLLAQVSRDVYDFAQRTVVLPRGTRLLGRYDNRVAVGQRRLLVVWTRMTLPDGTSFELPGLPGTDAAGAAGLGARVENHLLRLFGDALLLSLLAAGADLSQPANPNLTLAPSAGSVASAAVGQQLADVGVQLVHRDLAIQPTLRLAAGTAFTVFVNGDLPLARSVRRP